MNIIINGKTYDNYKEPSPLEQYLSEESLVLNSIELYNIDDVIASISVEANEQKEHSAMYTAGSMFVSMFDNFYRHIVSFTKKSKEFLQNSVKKLTNSDGIEHVQIKQGQDDVEIVGNVGLSKKSVRIKVGEFYRICGLVEQNGKNTMVRFTEKNKYLEKVKNLSVKMTNMVNSVCSELSKPNSNEQVII